MEIISKVEFGLSLRMSSAEQGHMQSRKRMYGRNPDGEEAFGSGFMMQEQAGRKETEKEGEEEEEGAGREREKSLRSH